MLRNSFIFLDKIGSQKERSIWNGGTANWDEFLSVSSLKGISGKSKPYYDRQILRAKAEAANDNEEYFAQNFPRKEHWRLYQHFKEQAVFIDIETSGLGFYDSITVVGLYDGYNTKTMIKGINLNFKALEEELK